MKPGKVFLLALGCALLLILFASCAMAEEPIKDQVRCYTTWDDFYFYIAISVDCPDIRATHSAPNADVSGDDCISVFVETDAKRANNVNPECFSMTVSPSGGAQFRAGNAAGALEPVPVWTFKYGNNAQGTLNNGDDIDQGYSVEMAIPWSVLKIEKLSLGDMMGFNFIVRRHGDKPGDFVSLSPEVKTEQDVIDPAKWSKIVFANYSFGIATAGWDKILSARYMSRAPLINGSISDKEWHANTSFAMDMPVPEGFVYEAKFPVQPLVFAAYDYNYQADKRKSAPVSGITNLDGTPALLDFPAKNAGPWFSYDRVQWHKEELSDMLAAGIDVVAPVYRGDAASRAGYADKGLDCLVSALEELRAEGKPYPRIAMMLDASNIEPAEGDVIVEAALYNAIRSFFARVPEDYRAFAQTSKPNAGRLGPIVFLNADARKWAKAVPKSIAYCNEQFEKDFGVSLVWGDESTGKVTPGYDHTALVSNETPLISRLNGETYEKQWATAIEKKANWVLCDAWSGFSTGCDLCTTRQYDGKYLDATRVNTKRFAGNRDFDAQYLSANVPPVIGSKQIAQAELEIKNAGNSPWRTAEGYALAYRWYKTGRYYGESKVRLPLGRDVLPGETITVDIGIATVKAQGPAIPDGNWELRFEIIRTSDGKWFSVLGDQPLVVPVTVGQTPEWAATWLTCEAPVMMASGQDYPTTIRVRNDGSQVWPKGVVKLGCKLYKTSSESSEAVPIKDVRAVLSRDCKPGEITEFVFDLNLVGADKKPIASWKQGDPWSYQLRFDLNNDQNWLSESGVRTLNRVVDIFDTDFGPRIVDCDISRNITAGQKVDVKVVVRNSGAQTWDKKWTKIGYHWYHLDGTEMLWDGITTPIKQNIQPGWPIVVGAQVEAPEYDGQYVLVWDVMIDDQWLSTGPLSRGGDILPVFVEVTGGKLAFVNLADKCDVQLSSPDTDRTAGDFDGKGSSFPSELLPPDAGLTSDVKRIYPSGYNWVRENQPEGRVSFLYPDKTPGTPGAVACNGQRVSLEQRAYSSLHILAASTNGDAACNLSLDYSKGPEAVSVQMSDWSKGPAHGEKIGYAVRHRHTHGGDEVGAPCYLFDYTIPLDSSRTLSSITLPTNPDIKVVAITLERVEMPPLVVNEVKEPDNEPRRAKP
ncbi:MAG: sugar-binding protein [Armatimonadota bacterium]